MNVKRKSSYLNELACLQREERNTLQKPNQTCAWRVNQTRLENRYLDCVADVPKIWVAIKKKISETGNSMWGLKQSYGTNKQ